MILKGVSSELPWNSGTGSPTNDGKYVSREPIQLLLCNVFGMSALSFRFNLKRRLFNFGNYGSQKYYC